MTKSKNSSIIPNNKRSGTANKRSFNANKGSVNIQNGSMKTC